MLKKLILYISYEMSKLFIYVKNLKYEYVSKYKTL
jgi:hypothetical protein